MKYSLLSALMLFLSLNMHARDLLHETYDWEENPKHHEFPEAWKTENEVKVKDLTIREYANDEYGYFVMYSIDHTIIHLNTSEAVDENNKLYLPVADASSIITQKARVIKPNGKVLELDQDDIKEAKNEESGYTYKYFALEGLEVGDEIEYIYHLKNSPRIYGSRITAQSSVPKLNYSYEIVCPKYLIFGYKGYNGFPGFTLDSSSHDDHSVMRVAIDTLPHLQDETGALYGANLMQFVYKLEENISSRRKNIINYSDAAKNIYNNILGDNVEKNEKKAAAKMVKKLKIDPSLAELEKVKLLEDHIKENIIILDISSNQLSNIKELLKISIANDMGATKLFANSLESMGIDFEIVLTCDRTDLKFDKDFEAYNFLETYLIYLPGLDLFLDPTDRFSAIGLIDWEYTNNSGLFISKLKLAGVESGIGEIRYIPFANDKASISKMTLNADFSDGLEEPTYTLNTELTGYYAWPQPLYTIQDEEWAENTNEAQVKFITENMDIKEVKASNIEWSDLGDKPYIIDATFSSNEFVEKAANKYLFKVGELIGPQMDLYQEKDDRKLPVEESYCRTYDRTITFKIPDGYTCDNLDDFNMNVLFKKDGKVIMGFTSSYTLKGKSVTVTIKEWYTDIDVETSDYTEYQKVINAAADFNKITMVFEPAE